MKTTACIILMSLASALFNWTSKDSMEQVMDKYKREFRTYDYTGYANHQVKNKTVCMEFTAFKGVSYKLLFCSTISGVPVAINVYDKNSESANRKKIFDNSHNVSGNHWVFEPRCSGTYYVEYSVPASCNNPSKISFRNRCCKVSFEIRACCHACIRCICDLSCNTSGDSCKREHCSPHCYGGTPGRGYIFWRLHDAS